MASDYALSPTPTQTAWLFGITLRSYLGFSLLMMIKLRQTVFEFDFFFINSPLIFDRVNMNKDNVFFFLLLLLKLSR